MIFCNKCGTEQKEDIKFCNKCGNKLKKIKPHKESEHEAETGKKGHCVECGAKLEGSEKFCGECGAKQSKSATEGKTGKVIPKVSPTMRPWLIPIGVLVIAAILLLPTKTVSYQVNVPYIDKEQYTVDVPYEAVEPYTVQVPYETTEEYTERVPVQEEQSTVETQCHNEYLKYNVKFEKCSASWVLVDGESTISAQNVDSQDGTFSFNVGYVGNDGVFYGTNAITKTIMAGRSELFSSPITATSFKECRWTPASIPQKQVCENVPGTKTVTNYKDVVKTRTVTKYRDETQYRTVTKTRTETRQREIQKTRTETHYKKVNWLFGFDVPW